MFTKNYLFLKILIVAVGYMRCLTRNPLRSYRHSIGMWAYSDTHFSHYCQLPARLTGELTAIFSFRMNDRLFTLNNNSKVLYLGVEKSFLSLQYGTFILVPTSTRTIVSARVNLIRT